MVKRTKCFDFTSTFGVTNCSRLTWLILTLQWNPFFLQRSHLFLSDHTSGETQPSPQSSCLQHPGIISAWTSPCLLSWMWPHHSHPQRGRRAARMWHRLDRMSESSPCFLSIAIMLIHLVIPFALFFFIFLFFELAWSGSCVDEPRCVQNVDIRRCWLFIWRLCPNPAFIKVK